MKITYITQYYPPHTGGLEYVAQKTAASAAAAGHTVDVVTYALAHGDRGSMSEKGVTIHRVPGIHFFDTHFNIPFVIGGVAMVRTIMRVVRQADIVHLHDVFYPTSLVTYLAARWYRTPLVLSQHVAMVKHSSALVMLVERLIYGLWGRRIFFGSTKIVVYQTVVRDFLLAQGVPSEKIVETHNGVDVALFTPISDEEKAARRARLGLPVDKPVVLFVGRLVPKKGYKELFEARDDAYDIVFVGPGEVPHEWHTTSGVHVLGNRTPEEVREIYPIVDVLAAPSTGEMFTLVMQEAFASSLPVVATDAPEYAPYKLDRERIALCEPTGPALKAVLQRIVADSALREHMGAYSRGLAEEFFDWDKNVATVLSLYHSLHEHAHRVVVTTSWDDGHVLDVKLAALLKQYGVAGTFYVAPDNVEFPREERLSMDQVRTLSNEFEIGAHTLHHQHLPTLTDDDAASEIETSKKVLEDTIGKPVTSFCYPAGKYEMKHVAMVKRAGFTLARTVQRFSLVPSKTPLEEPTSVHTYDHWSDVLGLLWFVRGNPLRFIQLYRRWDAQAIAMFDRVLQNGGVFHLWGHSWELESRDGWRRLERVLKHISNKAGVSYEANSALA